MNENMQGVNEGCMWRSCIQEMWIKVCKRDKERQRNDWCNIISQIILNNDIINEEKVKCGRHKREVKDIQ